MEHMNKLEQAVLTRVLRQLGRHGGCASAAALTPCQRRARAAKTGKASAAALALRKETAYA
jgi:hypothetical protein